MVIMMGVNLNTIENKEKISQLREMTNEPLMMCKQSLFINNGDIDLSLKWLQRNKSILKNYAINN